MPARRCQRRTIATDVLYITTEVRRIAALVRYIATGGRRSGAGACAFAPSAYAAVLARISIQALGRESRNPAEFKERTGYRLDGVHLSSRGSGVSMRTQGLRGNVRDPHGWWVAAINRGDLKWSASGRVEVGGAHGTEEAG